uniref:Uncharacterized protein n=1 Tax=Syphacia muris TaxID=451379 RepID=A0A0N5ACE7_9BILA
MSVHIRSATAPTLRKLESARKLREQLIASVELLETRESEDKDEDEDEEGVTGSGKGKYTKLPHLKIPTFKGDPTEWPVFRGKFEKNIDQRKDLSPADKLSYLMMFLEGPPLELVKEYHETDKNYSIIVNLLKKHYSNPDEIVIKLFVNWRTFPIPGNS